MKPAILIIALLLILAACKTCEDYEYTECPNSCELCPHNIFSSYMGCHTKEYCKMTFECMKYNVSNCPDECAVCPPCRECSSVSCQSEQYCESIGFGEEWYSKVQKI